MGSVKAAPAVAGRIADGYGVETARALIDSIEFYVGYMESANMALSQTDAMNIHLLARLLRAVLSDSCGIDVK